MPHRAGCRHPARGTPRYFGPSERPDGSLSSASTNLASDAFFTAVNDSGIVERLAAAPAPYGPTEDVRRLSRGWAAGFNRFLREGKITDPACKGAPWLRPVTEMDVYRRGHALAMLGGSGMVTDQITGAEAPAENAVKPSTQPPEKAAEGARNLMADAGMGSNAIAVGGGATANGRGSSSATRTIPGTTGAASGRCTRRSPASWT